MGLSVFVEAVEEDLGATEGRGVSKTAAIESTLVSRFERISLMLVNEERIRETCD